MAGSKAAIRRSLRFRLSAWLSVLILGVAIVAGAISFLAAFEEAIEFQDDTLRQIAVLFDTSHMPVDRATGPLIELASDDESRVVVQLLPGFGAELSTPSSTRLRLAGDLPEGLQTVEVNDHSWRVYVKTLGADSRIAVGQRTDVRNELARDGALHTLAPFIILLPILVLVLRSIVRRMMEPMAELASDLDGRSENDLGTLNEANLPSEVRPFVTAINLMFGRVSRSVSQQRRFIADAAHELRSPLTALSLQAERLAGAPMSETARERLEELRQGMRRARMLLDQLLALARAQETSSGPVAAVSVQQMFRQIIEDLLPQAENKRIDIGVTSADDVRIAVAEMDLKTLLRNLVDNAIRYTPQGGRVDLSVSSADDGILVQVSDTGPGIAPDERERAFEAFYRSLDNDEIGSGLGLAIVKAIADRLGAVLRLDYADAPSAIGLRVTVLFPAPSRRHRSTQRAAPKSSQM